ncbi:MAG TPA: hypothetical protein VIW29_07010 [Polyangiaceae bacterium]
MSRPWSSPAPGCKAALLLALSFGCATSPAPARDVDVTLTRSPLRSIEIADALEALIAAGKASKADRKYAYERLRTLRSVTAEDALAHAIVAGRLAQVSGLGAPSLVAEVERCARSSAQLDPSLRSGAARRLLGTLYVMAPAALLEHGDSEVGLELLQDVVRRFPQHAPNHLRLAEGYVTLGDPGPARPHLCYCVAQRSALRVDENALLDELLEQASVAQCP